MTGPVDRILNAATTRSTRRPSFEMTASAARKTGAKVCWLDDGKGGGLSLSARMVDRAAVPARLAGGSKAAGPAAALGGCRARRALSRT